MLDKLAVTMATFTPDFEMVPGTSCPAPAGKWNPYEPGVDPDDQLVSVRDHSLLARTRSVSLPPVQESHLVSPDAFRGVDPSGPRHLRAASPGMARLCDSKAWLLSARGPHRDIG